MRRPWFPLTSLTLVLWLLAAPASAHVMLMPGDVPASTPTDRQIMVVHGCGPGGTIPASDDEISPTMAVEVQVPPAVDIAPHDVDGWEWSRRADDHGATVLRWEHDDPTGTDAVIYLDVTVTAEEGHGELWLPVRQECTDGEVMHWTVAGMEERDGQLPAMAVGIEAGSGGGFPGGSTALVFGLAFLVAAAAAGVSVVLTGRRARGAVSS